MSGTLPTRNVLLVDAAENDDEVRTYYELPDSTAHRIRPPGDSLALDQALLIILNHPVFQPEHHEAMEGDIFRLARENRELRDALKTAHHWMKLGFEGQAQGRSGSGEADAEVRAALRQFAR